MLEKRLIKTRISNKPKSLSLIVSLSVLIFSALVSNLYWRSDFLNFDLAASGESVFFQGHYWQLFSTTLVHGDLQHLLSNAFMLGILGYFIYAYFGLMVFPFVTFFFAGITNLIVIYTYKPEVHLIGASGWVYVLAGFWLLLYILIERQRPLHWRILRALGVGMMILFPTTFEPRTSYLAHFVGFLVGLVLAAFYFLVFKENIRRDEVWEYKIEVQESEDILNS